jgi:hypothetical protein
MSKKKWIYDDFEDDDLVLDKKTKRRLERAAREREAQQQREEEKTARENPEEAAQNDLMSQIALLCQECRWREALLLGRRTVREATEAGHADMAAGLSAALEKIEKSMRRQMVAGLVEMSQEMLKKEFFPDVCE